MMQQVMMVVFVMALGAIGCTPATAPAPLAVPISRPTAVPTSGPTLAASPMPAASSMPAPTSAPKSGLQITATIGPTCPGPQRAGQVCTAPYAGVFIISTRDGREVAHFTTDDQGRARLDLQPGDYTLSPKLDPANRLPRGGPVDVTVVAGQYVDVALDLDTGMR